MIVVDTNAVLVMAAIIFVGLIAAYAAIFLWSRKEDREFARQHADFERKMEELFRR